MKTIKFLLVALLVLIASCSKMNNKCMFAGKFDEGLKVENEDTSILFRMDGGTYYQNVYVAITNDENKIRNLVNDLLPEKYDETDFDVEAALFRQGNYPPILWVRGIPRTGDQIAVANHELFHATVAIMNWAGITLSDDSEEAFAYQLQYFSSQFYNTIQEYEVNR